MKNTIFPLGILILYLMFYSNFTTIGVVLDTRLWLVLITVVLLCISIIRIRRHDSKWNYIWVLASIVLLFLSLNEKFLKYKEQNIAFENDGVKLYGTLYTPNNEVSDCLVIFIHGSGVESRKESAFYARQLVRNGVSAFAYDKRGSGRSEGNVYDVGYKGYAADAIKAIEKIQSINSFDKVGLFGASEGEWVSLIVDSLAEIDFMVIVSPSGASPLEQTHRERIYNLERKNFTEEEIQEASELCWDVLSFTNDSLERIDLEKRIMESKDQPWYTEENEFYTELYYYPWWHAVMNFNTQEYLSKTETEILIMIGTENDSYPYNETLNNYSQYSNTESLVYQNATHGMLIWKLGNNIPPPFFPKGYLDDFTRWIQEKCKEN